METASQLKQLVIIQWGWWYMVKVVSGDGGWKGPFRGRLWVNKQQYWEVREHAFGEKKLNQGDGFWRMERKNSRCGGIAVAIRDEFHL
jgi:hypothetical protein